MSEMINKAGRAVRAVARELCSVAPGERIPTVTELEQRCDASRGNIQKALAFLKGSGAVGLEAHGQNGTLLTGIDYLALARECGVSHLIGAMPLPYTMRYEGLATGLFTLFNAEGIRSYITFQRGSESRVQTLLDHATDYCVMSRLAYNDYVSHGVGIVAALDCGPSSYVGRHVLFVRDESRTDWGGARVGIDPSSVDQQVLTERYFADKGVEFVPVQYTHIVDMIQSGELDAGIWNEDDIHVRAGNVLMRELEGGSAYDDNTSAVVVVRSDDAFTRCLVRTLATPADIVRIQKRVMDREIPARY